MERYIGNIYDVDKPIVLPDEILEKAYDGYVPEISDDKLRWRYHKVRPVVMIHDFDNFDLDHITSWEKMCIVKGLHTNQLHQLYIYCVLGKYISEFKDCSYDIKRKIPCPEIVVEKAYNPDYIGDFLCLHKFESIDFFSTSIAQILAQIPDNLLKEANLFKMSEYPIGLIDVEKYPELARRGYHLSRVKAYNYQKKENNK